MLDLVHECDEIVGKMVGRPLSYASDRSRDFVVSVLAVRAFRLAISSLQVALSGYVDSTSNLDRTVFEIGIRLLDISTAPEAASLGYLMQGATEEISVMEVELAHRTRNGTETVNLPANLNREREHLEDLRKLCIEKGIDPELALKKHGKLNVRETCRKFGIEKAYLVDYALDSSHVHEKNVATSHFHSESTASHEFELGPIPVAVPHAVADTLRNLSLVLEIGCQILEDQELIRRTADLRRAVQERISKLGMADRPGGTA